MPCHQKQKGSQAITLSLLITMSLHNQLSLTLVTCPLLVFRVSLEERMRERADRVRLDDLGVVVPDGPRVVLVLLVCARTLPDLKKGNNNSLLIGWQK